MKTVTYEVDGGIARLTINRPEKYNALLLDTLLELRDAIDAAAADDNVRVLVLASSGERAFSAGIDLASGLFEDAGNLTGSMERTVLPLLEAIENNDKPLIASVQGMAVGLAASIVLACDLIVMSENAELRLVFAHLGIVPDGGACWQLVDRLGYSRALELALDGATLDAESCESLGIANRVVKAGELDDVVTKWSQRLAAGSMTSTPLTKTLMRRASRGAGLLDIAQQEADVQGTCVASDFCVEAYTRFLDSRGASEKKGS